MNNMCKTSLILDLYKAEKITLEEAKQLLEQEVRYVYYSQPYQGTGSPYQITYTTTSSGYTS